ncbi:MAG: UvrD-helicase domain-containing protein [Phycisphaerales bacterium]
METHALLELARMEEHHAGQHSQAKSIGPAWLSKPAATRAPASPAEVDIGLPPELSGERFDAEQPAAKREAWQDSLLDGLTEQQRKAVLHTEGPLLVLAAAGSGKTRVITRRIAQIIALGVPPWQILALTFTNKAAGEMRERVMHLLNPGNDPDARVTRGLTVTTFHSLCARLLRRYAEAAGIKPDYTIYDSGDQATLVKKAIEALQLSTSNFQPRAMLSAISNAKNQLLGPEEYAARAFDFSSKNISKIYSAYERSLRQANAVDFDDLLLLTARLLQRDEKVRSELQNRWQYLLVDEYQDTNKAQFVIASLIAGEESGKGNSPASERRGTKPNICVVGDPDQAIYGWRGADISNILDFEEHYPSAATITLGENFRSTAPILKVADTLIRNNKRRKHKDLFTSKAGGNKIHAVLCRDERHEAMLVVEWLKKLKSESGSQGRAALSWKDMAIFYRTNALSRVLEEALRSANLPYSIARGTAFYEREEVKNALAYLRVVANAADSVSLARIVNTPSRGISDATIDKIEAAAGQQGVPLLAFMTTIDLAHGEAMGMTSRAVNSIVKFVSMVDSWTNSGNFMGQELREGSLAELVDRVIKESGLEAMYRKQAQQSQSETDSERLDNLAELVSSARQFELEYDPTSDAANETPRVNATGESATPIPPIPPLLALLRAYLESVALVADADAVDPSQGSVTLMTLHAAKGLEFPVVAMVGLEEGLLPHTRAVVGVSDNEMEEERRLCFVGITRAMQHLMMSAAKYRTLRGNLERTIPSRFLSEMPQSELVVSDQSDVAADLGREWGEDDDEFGGGSTRHGGPPGGTLRPVSRGGNPAANTFGFAAGAKVRHPQFGFGVIRSVTTGSQPRAIIEFRDVGTKTLVLEYARLTKVS